MHEKPKILPNHITPFMVQQRLPHAIVSKNNILISLLSYVFKKYDQYFFYYNKI